MCVCEREIVISTYLKQTDVSAGFDMASRWIQIDSFAVPDDAQSETSLIKALRLAFECEGPWDGFLLWNLNSTLGDSRWTDNIRDIKSSFWLLSTVYLNKASCY